MPEMNKHYMKLLNLAYNLPDDESRSACMEGAKSLEREQWRPIETAPRDGTRILLYRRATGVEIGAYSENDQQWLSEENYTRYPTHWRPLPPGPGEDHSGNANKMVCGQCVNFDGEECQDHGHERGEDSPACKGFAEREEIPTPPDNAPWPGANGKKAPATCEECRTLEAGGWCRIEGNRRPGQAVCGSFVPKPHPGPESNPLENSNSSPAPAFGHPADEDSRDYADRLARHYRKGGAR